MRPWLVVAALLGMASVGFGAFAAHGIRDARAQDLLRTGALYGFVHVLAAFVAANLGLSWPPRLFIVGVAIFAGTLWAMALGAPAILGAITPIGGVTLMVGWAMLAWAMLRRQA